MTNLDLLSWDNVAGDDVVEARNKLNDALNEIVDKNDESFSSADGTENIRGTLITTPLKRGNTGKGPRKKKRKDFLDDEFSSPTKNPSYVVKIFDRQVDLSQFDENSTLYQMIREWMKNKPYSPAVSNTLNSKNLNDELEEKTKQDIEIIEIDKETDNFVYSLPIPKTSEIPSCPVPLPPIEKNANIEDIIGTDFDIEELRKDNMNRWKRVKNVWREHSFRTQEHHTESLKILKDLFTPTPAM